MHYSKEQRSRQAKLMERATKSNVTQAEILLLHDSVACAVNQLQIISALLFVWILIETFFKILHRK